MSVLVAVLAFGVMIMAHELGHMLVAKRVGVRVHTFALGFGPTLAQFRRGETHYRINAIPFGGYVRMEGEDLDEATGPTSFRSKTVWQRMAVIAAGPAMNVLLAAVILAVVALAWGIPTAGTRVAVIEAGWPAEAAGLRPGDEIVGVNGQPNPAGVTIVRTISRSVDSPVVLEIRRGGQTFTVTVTPRYDPRLKVGRIGFSPTPVREHPGPVRAAGWAVASVWQMATGFVAALAALLTPEAGEVIASLGGPVAAVSELGRAARVSLDAYLGLGALMSVLIGLFNLLPFPALDGGRLAFLVVEAVRGRPVDPRREGYIHLVGFALLLLLLVTLTVRDIGRLLPGS